jgi:hypothetical protein
MEVNPAGPDLDRFDYLRPIGLPAITGKRFLFCPPRSTDRFQLRGTGPERRDTHLRPGGCDLLQPDLHDIKPTEVLLPFADHVIVEAELTAQVCVVIVGLGASQSVSRPPPEAVAHRRGPTHHRRPGGTDTTGHLFLDGSGAPRE